MSVSLRPRKGAVDGGVLRSDEYDDVDVGVLGESEPRERGDLVDVTARRARPDGVRLTAVLRLG
jgi:hypothetical protein